MTTPPGSGFWRCGRCGTPNPAANYVRNCVACGADRGLVAQRVVEDPPQEARSRSDSSRSPREPRRRSAQRGRLGFGLAAAVAWLLAVLVVLVATRGLASVPWPTGLLLLMPRAIWLLPALPIGVAAIARRSRLTASVTVLGSLIVLGPLMGFNIPWGGLLPAGEGGPSVVRVLSLNRGGVAIDAARLIKYIERYRIDVLCFQEFGDDPLLDEYLSKGWNREKDGYIATRHEIVSEIPPPPEQNADQERYTMSLRRLELKRADGLRFQVASVHMPTLSRGLSGGLGVGFRPSRFQAHLDWWSKEFGRLVESLSEHQDHPLIVAGDLNMPADHPLLRELRSTEVFRFAFEERAWGYGYTKPPDFGWARIDHVLSSREWEVRRCWIGPSFGSDHRSIVAEFELPPVNP
ncbi:MAG: endonuclease/exonuclease/phosphatase family protein [Isosphaeraceae bacterium]|nr:endonuclease/exonuclease/phosphatase family protein [Isosphaeraceae bacterium]